ncbi:MAG: carboxypeptidase regulatory-like domain-containing protein [Ilumatobacteraceae bacterium]
MTPVVSVNVTVVDEGATPVVGASVTLVDSSGTSHPCPDTGAVTGAGGLCTIPNVTRGPALIDASAPSVGSTSIAVGVSSSPSAVTVQLASDRSTVTGTVTDADTGTPISSAVVRLTQASGRVLSTTTDSLGKIYFANVPVGSWSLELSGTGYTTPSPVPLSITAGTFTLDSEDTQLTSIAVTSLRGTVESSGTSVPGALVALTRGDDIRSAITNGAGEYLLTNLSAGVWQLDVFAPGYGGFSPTSVTLVLGSNEQDVEVTALDGALKVSALLSSGAAVSGVAVEIFEGATSEQAQTGAGSDGLDDGVFTFSGLPAGQYRVVVTDTVVPARYPEISFTVNIDRGFTTQIPVYLGSSLSSVVIGFAGIPAPGFGPQTPLALSVSLIDDQGDGDPANDVTVSAPTVSFFDRSTATFVNVPDGDYDVLIDGDGVGGADAEFTMSGSTWVVPSIDPIAVDGPTSIDAGLILLTLKTVDVDITASTDCADPIPTQVSTFTATVRDGYLLSPRSASATTGTADFDELTPGTYEVEITATGYSEVVTELEVDDWSVAPTQSACIEVGESGNLVPLVVTVQSGGADLSGATVLIEELGVSCRTNSDGECTVYVPPGQYDITAEKTSYGTVTGEDVTVGLTGGSATVSLTTTATTIVFEAYEEDGTVITGFSVDSVTDAKQCSDDDSDGDCVITGLDADPRAYEITKTGFETVFVGATAVEGSELSVPVVLSPSPTATDSLRVHALDASTGAAITDFDVYNDADGTVLCAELADPSDGNNWCDAGSTVDFGSVTLRIESTDFIDAFVTVTVTEETDSVLYVALLPVEEAPSDPELLLTVTSSRTGDAISGATVSVTGLDSGSPSTCGLAGSSGTTDASGRCLVTTTNASTDEITVTISKTTGDTYRSTSVIVAMTPGQNNVVAVDMVPTGALTINTPAAPAGGRAVTVVGIGVVCTVVEAATSCTSSTALPPILIPFGTWKVTSSGLTPATVSITDFTGNSVTMTT